MEQAVTLIGDKWAYYTENVVGTGTCGCVNVGYDQQNPQQKVAIKIINLLNLQNMLPRWKEQIRTESKIMKDIDHCNIVRAYDVKMTKQSSEPIVYIIMELCEDQNLSTMISNNDGLKESQAKQIFLQVLQGYQVLHDKKIIHRDLKPENILFKNGQAKITDFGLSKILDEKIKEDTITNQSEFITVHGTPLYRCPELLTDATYTPVKQPEKIDIWSMGVIYYQMLYNQLPWNLSDVLEQQEKQVELMDIVDKIEKSDISFPETVEVSDQAKNLISCMLQHDENLRYNFQQVKEHDYIKQ